MANIQSIKRDQAYSPFIVRIVTEDTLAAVGTAGYLTAQADVIAALNEGAFAWEESDMVLVYASDGWGFFQVDPDFASLTPFVFGGSVVGAPVVVGNFPVFQSTSGNLEDLGYLPSDASKTSVVMAGSAVQVGYIAHFVDTAGTIDDTAGAVINAGNIQAGLSGTAGGFISYPGTASRGSLRLVAVANAGDTITTISNASMGQASVISIPDPGVATANFLLSENASGQTIATGSLTLTAGSLTLTAGSIIMTAGYYRSSVANALTAHAGGGQASALQLAREVNRVTTVGSAGDSVKLPVSVAGMQVVVINAAAANAMDVFPSSGEQINALGADTALSVAANSTVLFVCAVAGQWNTIVTA